MDEFSLKEFLAKESEKVYSPSFQHDISGWNDDNIKPVKYLVRTKIKKKPQQPLFISSKKTKIQPPQHKKNPFSQYEFLLSTTHKIKYQVKKPKNSLNRPQTVNTVKRVSPSSLKPKMNFTNILLNRFVNLNSSFHYKRSALPKRLNRPKIYRRSMSSCEENYIDPIRSLIVNGSNCTLKL